LSYILKQQLVPGGLTNNPNMPLKSISYVTIHNADTYNLTANAQASANYLTNNSQGSQASWHYTADDIHVMQSFDDSQECWHAGDGAGPGNTTSIAIEISTNWGFVAQGQTQAGVKNWEQATDAEKAVAQTQFQKACDNAAQLTADLLKKHSLGIEKVVQHNYWKSSKYPTGKDCPYAIRKQLFGTSWEWFLGLVKKYYDGGTIDMGFQVGDIVQIVGADAVYTNGVPVPASVKNRPFTVKQVNVDKLLLAEINSWVYSKDCQLVSTPVTPPSTDCVPKADYDQVVAERDAQQQRADIAEGKLAHIKAIVE